jgi:hypothetical protein
MKALKFSLIVFLTSLLFVGCSKNNDNPAPASSVSNAITGTWQGKYGTGSNNPSSFYSFRIKVGGVLEELGSAGQVLGTGTWKLDNNIITGSYTYPSGSKYSFIGAFDASKKQIIGDWGYGSSATNGGLWDMDKKSD